MRRSFHELVDEAERAPIVGWEFGWLDRRASEERPTWHYFERFAEQAATVSRMLELQTGAGGMIAELPKLPELMVAIVCPSLVSAHLEFPGEARRVSSLTELKISELAALAS